MTIHLSLMFYSVIIKFKKNKKNCELNIDNAQGT